MLASADDREQTGASLDTAAKTAVIEMAIAAHSVFYPAANKISRDDTTYFSDRFE